MNETLSSCMIKSFFSSRTVREGKKIAVVDYDTKVKYTYNDMISTASKTAYFLKKAVGVERNDRIALFARNGIWSLTTFYAMPIAGTILTTYNCMLKITEQTENFRSESPKVVFYESVFLEKVKKVKELLPDSVFVAIDGENTLGDWTYSKIMDCPEFSEEWANVDPEDICMLLHTGGTTGSPKSAMISYRAVILNTLGQVVDYSIGKDAVVYVSFPFFHTASWNSALPVLLTGGKIYLKKKFDPKETLRMVDEEQLSSLSGSPSVFRKMYLCEEFKDCSFASVRALRCGSATPTKDLVEKYWEKGEWISFYNGYGMTEAGSGTLSLPMGSMSRELSLEKMGSVGKPMIFAQCRIVDDDGNDVKAGEKGELIIKNGVMFSGYWKKEEATKEVVIDGWFHTGDIAMCDSDGFFFICGRKKNMFISGGENVYPLEIETVLLDHPAIADVYVFGVEDLVWGEVGKAIVALRTGASLTKDEIITYLSEHLSTIKIPKYIQFVSEVPRNEAGKIIGEEIKVRYSFPND